VCALDELSLRPPVPALLPAALGVPDERSSGRRASENARLVRSGRCDACRRHSSTRGSVDCGTYGGAQTYRSTQGQAHSAPELRRPLPRRRPADMRLTESRCIRCRSDPSRWPRCLAGAVPCRADGIVKSAGQVERGLRPTGRLAGPEPPAFGCSCGSGLRGDDYLTSRMDEAELPGDQRSPADATTCVTSRWRLLPPGRARTATRVWGKEMRLE
jgi:hypothetical protein